MVEMETALVAVKCPCVLSVSDNAMFMAIFVDLPSNGASSSSNLSHYGLGPAFLKETPSQMPHYFPIDLNGAPLFHSKAIDWGKWEKRVEPSSWYKYNCSWADWVDRMFSQKQEKWKKMGLTGAILSSKSDMPFNQFLFSAFFIFLSPTSNVFFAPRGSLVGDTGRHLLSV